MKSMLADKPMSVPALICYLYELSEILCPLIFSRKWQTIIYLISCTKIMKSPYHQLVPLVTVNICILILTTLCMTLCLLGIRILGLFLSSLHTSRHPCQLGVSPHSHTVVLTHNPVDLSPAYFNRSSFTAFTLHHVAPSPPIHCTSHPYIYVLYIGLRVVATCGFAVVVFGE